MFPCILHVRIPNLPAEAFLEPCTCQREPACIIHQTQNPLYKQETYQMPSRIHNMLRVMNLPTGDSWNRKEKGFHEGWRGSHQGDPPKVSSRAMSRASRTYSKMLISRTCPQTSCYLKSNISQSVHALVLIGHVRESIAFFDFLHFRHVYANGVANICTFLMRRWNSLFLSYLGVRHHS